MAMATVMRFYGLSYDQICEMPTNIYISLFEAVGILQSRERLFSLNLMDYPNMKKEGRTQLFKSIRKKAYPDFNPKTISFDELEGALRNV